MAWFKNMVDFMSDTYRHEAFQEKSDRVSAVYEDYNRTGKHYDEMITKVEQTTSEITKLTIEYTRIKELYKQAKNEFNRLSKRDKEFYEAIMIKINKKKQELRLEQIKKEEQRLLELKKLKHEDKKHEDKKHEDKKHEDKKHEDKKHEDKKHEDKKPEDKSYEDIIKLLKGMKTAKQDTLERTIKSLTLNNQRKLKLNMDSADLAEIVNLKATLNALNID